MKKSRRESPIVRVLREHGILDQIERERQLELDLKPITLADRIRDLASTMKVSACPECGRRGYHLITCSIGRSAL